MKEEEKREEMRTTKLISVGMLPLINGILRLRAITIKDCSDSDIADCKELAIAARDGFILTAEYDESIVTVRAKAEIFCRHNYAMARLTEIESVYIAISKRDVLGKHTGVTVANEYNTDTGKDCQRIVIDLRIIENYLRSDLRKEQRR